MLPSPNIYHSWFIEADSATNLRMYGVDHVIYAGQSSFHKIEIVKTFDYGKCLILNGHARVFELDEFIYHEGLILPLIARMKNQSNVLLAGDGDGGAVRELLNTKSVKKLTWIDIDGEVVEACKKYLGITSPQLFEDKRLIEVIGDARNFIENSNELYDSIVLSVSEPFPGGPSSKMYTKEFYELVASKLKDNGILAVQSGCSSFHFAENFANIITTLQSVFPFVLPYQIGLPSFGLNWGFSLSSKSKIPTPQSILRETRMYDLDLDKILFSIPKYLSQKIKGGKILFD